MMLVYEEMMKMCQVITPIDGIHAYMRNKSAQLKESSTNLECCEKYLGAKDTLHKRDWITPQNDRVPLDMKSQ